MWVFSVELHGLVIPKFRINHFITKSQLMCCVLCTYVFKRNVGFESYVANNCKEENDVSKPLSILSVLLKLILNQIMDWQNLWWTSSSRGVIYTHFFHYSNNTHILQNTCMGKVTSSGLWRIIV